MEFNLRTLLIVCPMVFLSGFVDSVAGGGGLISIPAYVFAGLPMINAYGTNKFSAALGTCVSSFKYFKSGNIHLPTGAASAAGAIIQNSSIKDKSKEHFFIMVPPHIWLSCR